MKNTLLIPLLTFVLLTLFTACAPVEPAALVEDTENQTAPPGEETTEPAVEKTKTPPTGSPTEVNLPEQTPSECADPFANINVSFNPSYWTETDFCKRSIEFSEVFSGGPPPDGIPAIDEPKYESVDSADEWLGEQWPVMFFQHNGDARAYPLAILMWHEIANAEVGGLKVALTFCPLCNATIAFNRTLPDGTVLDFGTSGNLRNSDLIMYDRQTQSWWQQFTGTGIVGHYTNVTLEFLPSQIISWADFRDNYPDGLVLSRDTGHNRDYGRNPYAGYDNINSSPFLFTGVVDGRLAAMARVVAVNLNGEDVAYSFSELETVGVANDEVGGSPVVVFWQSGVGSALDASDMDQARDIGSTAVYIREVDGQVLTFEQDGEEFVDLETGSRWNLFGMAVDGPLAGTQLEQVVSAEHFWFAWAAFKPDTRIWTAE